MPVRAAQDRIDNAIHHASWLGAFAMFAYGAALSLTGAKLQEASLFGTDLRNVRLRGAHLRGATASVDTRWPRGFNPESAGVRVLVRGD